MLGIASGIPHGTSPAVSLVMLSNYRDLSIGIFTRILLKKSRGISLEISPKIPFGVSPAISLTRFFPVLLTECFSQEFLGFIMDLHLRLFLGFIVSIGISTGAITNISYGFFP